MATVRYCDRHFHFGKRVDAKETDVPVEVDGIKATLDLCGTCLAAIKSWQQLVRDAITDDGVQEPTTFSRHTSESLKFLHSQSSA